MMKVLFVDDDSALLEQAKIFIEKEAEGVELETAISAKEALKMFDENNYDAIVSDYQMPEIDGLEFLKTIREERASDIPFLIFTGKGREEVAMEALNLGANRYLQKGGNPKSQYGVLADAIIHEVRSWEAEEELRRSEKEKSLILENAGEIIALHDTNHNIQWANKAYWESTGKSPEEGDGQKCYRVWGLDTLCKDCPVTKAIETGESFEAELNPKSQEHWPQDLGSWLVKASPIKDNNDNVIGAVEVASDITERKEKEEELRERIERDRKLFDSLGDAIFIVALGENYGEILMANDTAVEQTGWSRKELVGKDIHDWIVEGPLEMTVEEVAEKVREGKNVFLTLKRRKKDGSTYWAEETVVPFEYEGRDVSLAVSRDTTERKEMEEELQRERKRFQEIFNNANDAIYLLELTEEGMPGEFIEVNDVACEMLGYSREEFLEMTPQDIDSSKKADEVPDVMEELLEEGDVRFEMVHQAKDGTEIPVEIHSHLFELEGEERVLSMARDVSGWKERERELKRKDWYLDHMPEFIQIVDEEGNIIYRNRSLWRDDILDKNEIEGSGLLGFVHPEDREKAGEIFAKALENPGKEYTEELRGKTKDGWTWFEGKIINYLDKPEIEGIIVTGRDITERKKAEQRLRESEEKFRSYVENAPNGVFVVDKDGNYLEVNETACEMTGYSEEELLEMNVSNLATSEAQKKAAETFEELLETGEMRVELPYLKKDGSKGYWIINAVKLSDDRYLGFTEDITERRKAEEREEFLHSLLRHDVRNKAQVVQGYLELLEDFDLPEEAVEYLERGKKDIRESMGIIEKVSMLRKAEEEEVGAVRIDSIVESAVEENKSKAQERGMKIEMDCPDFDFKVRGGPLLKEVFTNLLSNSIRHSDGSRIRIGGRKPEDEIVCTIEDDGKGIPDADKEKIFEKGYTTDGKRGSGIGLFLVKRLLDIYDGSIEVKDSDLGGTRFDIRLRKPENLNN